MAKQTRQFRYRHDDAFRVTESWLRRAAAIIESAGFSTADISVTINQDRHLDGLTIDELLALPNTKAELITRIFIGAMRYGEESLSIGIYLYNSSCELSVSGDEKEALYAFEKLRSLMNDLRVWYGPLRRERFWLNLGCAMLLVLFASASVSSLLLALRFGGVAISTGLLNTAVFVSLSFTSASALLWLVEWAVKRLYPMVDILIGDGIARSSSLSDTRRNIFWVILAGIAVALGTAVITHLLGLT